MLHVNTFRRIFFLSLFALLTPLTTWAEATADRIVHQTKHFQVTQQDLDLLTAFYQTPAFTPAAEQALPIAIRFHIFALEAQRLGLDPISIEPQNQAQEFPPSFLLFLGQAQAYTTHLLDSYPVDDIVIESYYKTHPERFQEPDSPGIVLPLDDATRTAIREMLLSKKHNQIIEIAYQELQEQYAE